MTGGAGIQHSALGGFIAANFSSAPKVPGRCRIQMWSCAPRAMPLTCPIAHLFGNGGGQDASTWSTGTPPDARAAGTGRGQQNKHPTIAVPVSIPRLERNRERFIWPFLLLDRKST